MVKYDDDDDAVEDGIDGEDDKDCDAEPEDGNMSNKSESDSSQEDSSNEDN